MDTRTVFKEMTPAAEPAVAIPAYLRDVYAWAYLAPAAVRLFDHTAVVSLILWGNHRRLAKLALAEISPGMRVLQPACVYGHFSRDLAARIGSGGHLDIIDVAPIQVANCRRKLDGAPSVGIWHGDAADWAGGPYDAVCCYFLLHEVPDAYKARIVDNLLAKLAPGGRAVFVDYHRPASWHPLRPPMSVIFDRLEPWAKALWHTEIRDYASRREHFSWRKTTLFGGLYQKVVAVAPPDGAGRCGTGPIPLFC